MDKALEINPRYAEAWNNKGLTLDELGKHQEAMKCYNKALEINPRDEMAWLNMDLLFKSWKISGSNRML